VLYSAGGPSTKGEFTAVLEQERDWCIGYVEKLPGTNTRGRTLKEARENLVEVIQLVTEGNRELARRETRDT